ncbi:MAG: DUF488 domain-containing protein [Syntrophobacterales bacterium]|jgi:uncharacterized protein (DUF488 family)|nr:DUF488 domain-containing protein [Syntrophobacterales bacterium]
MAPAPLNTPLVLTIGHSTHPLSLFIQMLQAHAVTLVADVRTVPRSRHNPQFNRDTLARDLEAAAIAYLHLAGLGGWRSPRTDSPNQGWHNPAFRGYADYMLTPEFEVHLQSLIELSRQHQIALMCAEAVPWRCHRSLIADALLIRDFQIKHILSPTASQPHRLTPFARVEGTRLTYPPPLEGT